MFKDLIKGNVRLAVVYWVYGVFVGLVYRTLNLVIEKHYVALLLSPLEKIAVYALIVFPFIYFPFIYVAIWRSANNYPKRKIWVYLAKAAVVIGSITLVINAINIINPLILHKSSNSALIQQAELLNKSLPQMVDQETELTHVSFDNQVLRYQYRLVKRQAQDINKVTFANILRNKITEKICNDNYYKEMLSQGNKLSYDYVDMNGLPIETFVISANDCS